MTDTMDSACATPHRRSQGGPPSATPVMTPLLRSRSFDSPLSIGLAVIYSFGEMRVATLTVLTAPRRVGKRIHQAGRRLWSPSPKFLASGSKSRSRIATDPAGNRTRSRKDTKLMDWHDSVAVVTGSNRGLGREFAAQLLERGAKKVYATARDPERVQIAGVTPVGCDFRRGGCCSATACWAPARCSRPPPTAPTRHPPWPLPPTLRARWARSAVNPPTTAKPRRFP